VHFYVQVQHLEVSLAFSFLAYGILMKLEDNSPFCRVYPKDNATTEDSCMEQNDANCS
jgi:hypothetical protein